MALIVVPLVATILMLALLVYLESDADSADHDEARRRWERRRHRRR